MSKILAIVGMCGSGKSVACSFFKSKGFKDVYFGGAILEKLKEDNLEITPENERIAREKLRQEYGMSAIAHLVLPKIESLSLDNDVVLDGLYSWEELTFLKGKYPNIKVLAIVANKRIRYSRISCRETRALTNIEANNRDISEIESINKGGPIAFADYYILNDGDIDKYNKDLEEIYKVIEEES